MSSQLQGLHALAQEQAESKDMVVTTKNKKKPKRPSPNPMSTARHRSPCRRSVSIPSALSALSVFLLFYVTRPKADSRTIHPPSRFYTFDIVNEFPHDPNAFTQGLLYGGNDTLFESTGLYGRVLHLHQMDGSLFGEGLTLLGERLLQVTWLKKTGFIYDRYNFSKLKKFTHQMQDGWGLATDGRVLYGSDGSSTLYQLDPITLKVIRRAIVSYEDRDVPFLNELEYVNGEVWANVWQTDCIARISHSDGTVIGWILLHELRRGLLRSGHTDIDVLNGIAWDEENDRLFVTGKLWPKLYEIKLRSVRGPVNGRIDELCPTRAY